MKRPTMVLLSQVCDIYRIDREVLREFSEFGLYPTIIVDGEPEIEMGNLDRLEEIISLHQALGINKEGIDIILELRDKISGLQDEVESLRGEVEQLKRLSWSIEPELLESQGLLIEIGTN